MVTVGIANVSYAQLRGIRGCLPPDNIHKFSPAGAVNKKRIIFAPAADAFLMVGRG
jgi:hypothetical protein